MKSIKRFNNAAEIFDEYGPNITKSEQSFFECELDFESILFYVIDNKTVLVCDSIDGTVFNSMSLKEFEFESFDNYAREKGLY